MGNPVPYSRYQVIVTCERCRSQTVYSPDQVPQDPDGAPPDYKALRAYTTGRSTEFTRILLCQQCFTEFFVFVKEGSTSL